jgi:hypothetical protein
MHGAAGTGDAHLLAVMQGALVNSRMDRVLGRKDVKGLLALVDERQLEDLRHSLSVRRPIPRRSPQFRVMPSAR